MSSERLKEIVDMLNALKEDSGVPKNVKGRINDILGILNSKVEKSIRVDKVMNIFDELSDDSNIDSFTRTQLWNVVSLLETL